MPWAVFFLSAAVIVIAGAKLSQYGDQSSTRLAANEMLVGEENGSPIDLVGNSKLIVITHSVIPATP
jgi:hypothetical protein